MEAAIAGQRPSNQQLPYCRLSLRESSAAFAVQKPPVISPAILRVSCGSPGLCAPSTDVPLVRPWTLGLEWATTVFADMNQMEVGMRRFLLPKLGLAGLLVMALVGNSAVWAEGPDAPPKGWTDGYVMANAIRLHYWRTGGEKPVLLMLHGFSDDGLCWTDLARELQAYYDIIMTDARGHGLSDPPTASDSADAQVEDIASVIRELDLENPVIMGHSMGSASAAWFAAKYPDIPRAVILEDPLLIPRPPRDPSDATASQQEKAMAQILARNNTPYEELLAECLRNSPGWSRSECEYWARSKRLYHPRLALRNTAQRPAIAALFEKIAVPTLILKAHAEGDDRAKNEQVAKILTRGRIEHVEGAGHCVHRDRMSPSLAVLREFLSELE